MAEPEFQPHNSSFLNSTLLLSIINDSYCIFPMLSDYSQSVMHSNPIWFNLCVIHYVQLFHFPGRPLPCAITPNVRAMSTIKGGSCQLEGSIGALCPFVLFLAAHSCLLTLPFRMNLLVFFALLVCASAHFDHHDHCGTDCLKGEYNDLLLCSSSIGVNHYCFMQNLVII